MRPTTLLATLALSVPAAAANVYILSSGDAPTDNAVVAALTSHGHTCTVGPQYVNFNGSQSLAGFHTVYLQNNYNWNLGGSMPAAGQQALLAWVNGGGRLVTCEWTAYYTSARFSVLAPIMPLNTPYYFGGLTSETYDLVNPNTSINAGVPSPVTFPLTQYGGTESYAIAKPNATVFYSTRGSNGAAGLAGWARGAGLVLSFSTTCGPAQLANADFSRLFSNVMEATVQPFCYANCDASTVAPVLNVGDFACYLNKFAAGDTAANCDGSVSPPVLNVLDFACFLNQFAAGC